MMSIFSKLALQIDMILKTSYATRNVGIIVICYSIILMLNGIFIKNQIIFLGGGGEKMKYVYNI